MNSSYLIAIKLAIQWKMTALCHADGHAAENGHAAVVETVTLKMH